MTDTAWKYLEMIWGEEHHDGDTSQAMAVIQELWPDQDRAGHELAEAYLEVEVADEDETARKALVSASEDYQVGGLPVCLPAMQAVLFAGLEAISTPAIAMLQRWFKESDDALRKARIALLLARFGKSAVACVPLLIAEVDNPADANERHVLRCACAIALGKLDVASTEVVDVLARVAGASSESQALRSYCIEALMDLGPPAASAIPILEQIFNDEEEDEDLRNFAWSALKSVGAPSREHPCGGTVAEHMRSLYRPE